MGLLLLTTGLMAIIMLVMGVGLLFNYPCLRGSCGGPEVTGPEGAPLSCEACPNRRVQHSSSG